MFHSYEPYRYFMTIIIDNMLCDTTLYRALSGVTTSYSNLASWEDDSRIERRWLAILPVIHCWRRNFFKSIEGTHNERFGKNQFRHHERCPTNSEKGECFAPHLAFGFSKASAPSFQKFDFPIKSFKWCEALSPDTEKSNNRKIRVDSKLEKFSSKLTTFY